MTDFERDALLQHINSLIVENVALREDLDRSELQRDDLAEKLRQEQGKTKILEAEVQRLEEDLVWTKDSPGGCRSAEL